MSDMTTTATTYAPGTVVLVMTKPFIDSDKLFMQEVEIIKIDRNHWHVKKNGRGHYCIPVETIQDSEAVA